MADHRVDLAILDVMLPGERRPQPVPAGPCGIVAHRARRGLSRILGLEMGADDYLAKPFNPRELLARINAVLRRQSAAHTACAINGADLLSLRLADPFQAAGANPAGVRVAMTRSAESDLLRVFCERSGRVLSRDSLLVHCVARRRFFFLLPFFLHGGSASRQRRRWSHR